MSYTRKKYTSRRERSTKIRKNTKRIIIAAICIATVLLYKNRIYIWDYV